MPPSSTDRNNIRTQALYLPNEANPALFDLPEADWRFPGMIGGTATLLLGAGTDTDPRGSKSIQLVRAASDMSEPATNGAVAWWEDQLTYTVTMDPSGRRGRVAGVFLGPVTPGNLGIIQTGGIHGYVHFDSTPTANPTAAGLIVIPSSNAGQANCLAAGSAATYPPLGVSAGAWDSVNKRAVVDLRLPQVT